MIWTESDHDELRRLWNEGLTAAQIAERMGPAFTRSAITGKARRLGLAERGSPTATGANPRFEAMIDLIADAPLNQPLSIFEAARLAGIERESARNRWRMLCMKMGEPGCAASATFGDTLVRPLD